MRWAEGSPTAVDNFRVWLTLGEKYWESLFLTNGFLHLCVRNIRKFIISISEIASK